MGIHHRVLLAAALLAAPCFAAAHSQLTYLRTFDAATEGKTLAGALLPMPDGFLYGVAQEGGAHGRGTVYRLNAAGTFQVLHPFAASGGTPAGTLIRGADGALYGTVGSRVGSGGSVFRVTQDGSFSTVRAFIPGIDGTDPQALVAHSDGNLYGVTKFGPQGPGSVFRLTYAGVLTTLHHFSSDFATDPVGTVLQLVQGDSAFYPHSLVQGADGALYGNALYGAFRITTAGEYTELPEAGSVPLILASDGRLYGAQSYGADGLGYHPGTEHFRYYWYCRLTDEVYGLSAPGRGPCYGSHTYQPGYVLRMERDGNGGQTQLHQFSENDGGHPTVALVESSSGDFYGAATGWQSTYGSPSIEPTIYRVTPAGDFTTLARGVRATSSLVEGGDGYLYGTTTNSVFRIAMDAPPRVQIDPPFLDFGGQALLTSSAPRTIVLRNNGDGPLRVATITPQSVAAPMTYRVSYENCPLVLQSGTACEIQVVFSPRAAGSWPGALTIADDAKSGPHTVPLLGTGLPRTLLP